MDDLISRKWLMECVEEGWIKFDTEKDTNKYIHLIRDTAPPAQPERTGKWIPLRERLPEEKGQYLVTRGLNACGAIWNRVYLINYSDLMGLKSERIWWNGNVGKSDFERIDDVIAWMPLPEPYAERRTDG